MVNEYRSDQRLSDKIDELLRSLRVQQAGTRTDHPVKAVHDVAQQPESGADSVERGARAIQELAAINRSHDREARQIWDRDQLAGKTNQVIAMFVECVRTNKDSISAEALLSGGSWFDGLDPACMYIIRAICGPQVFTNPVLDKVRDSWCSSDLPEDLFKILAVRDNSSFMERLSSYPFTWQEKTEVFVTSGMLRRVMAQ